MKRHITILATVLALAGSASAQYPTFLGASDPYRMAVTPRHHITVWTGGFDSPHPKWAKKKTYRLCMANGLPENSCLAAQEYVRRLTGAEAPSSMLEEVDAAADHVIDVWTACGGSYASYVRGFDWSRITVTVKDTIFPNPASGIMSGGLTLNGGRDVWLVNFWFDGWFCCRGEAGLATMGAYARWELGNAVVWGYHDRPIDKGDISPCSY